MAYSLDSSSSEGRVRVMIYDITSVAVPVIGTDYYFEDAHITAMLDQNSDDLWRTAADLCRGLAAKFSREAIELGLGKGDLKLNLTKKAKFYIDLALSYDNKSDSDLEEYMDSSNISTSIFGIDESEYVGDG